MVQIQMIQQIQLMDVIANDNINDSICIGNDNNDYTTKTMVIGLQKVVGIEVNENP